MNFWEGKLRNCAGQHLPMRSDIRLLEYRKDIHQHHGLRQSHHHGYLQQRLERVRKHHYLDNANTSRLEAQSPSGTKRSIAAINPLPPINAITDKNTVGLYTLIGVSFIAVIASCVRVSSLVLWIRSSDISWNYPLLPLLCMIQSCVALVTSSLPAIYPLLRKPTPEQISRRQSRLPDQDREKAWNSLEGSTLNNSRGDRRSRWSFIHWNGHHGPKAAQAGVQDVPEESKEVDEEASSVEVEEDRPATQHAMTAYVSTSDEARGISERMESHRRTFSADEESLTVPRIYIGGSGDGDSATSRVSGDDYQEIGHAR